MTMIQCEGYRRNGGAFQLGPVKWERCKNDATHYVTVSQDGKRSKLPACEKCLTECIDNGIFKDAERIEVE